MNVLFVSGYELGSTNANAVCLSNLIDEMRKYGEVAIDVIGDSIFEDGKPSWKNSPIVFAKRIIHWPSVQPDAINKCIENVKRLEISTYDFIVVPHKPYEVVVAILKLKEKKQKTKVYLYELDPMTNEIDRINGVGRHLSVVSRIKERLMYNNVDHIFHMECNRSKYSARKYERYKSKSSYLDFPILTKNPSVTTLISKGDELTRFLYSGGLDKTYRNPSYTLRVLDALSKQDTNTTYIYDFFSKGNCEEDIAEIAKRNDSFVQHGYVDQQDLTKYCDKADFLINISNQYSDMVPSKVFAYISQCKPIIHFTNNERDGCISYLHKYGLALIVDENDPFDANVQKVIKFVKDNKGKKLDYCNVAKLFVKNTARWSVDQILKQMKKDYQSGV